MSQTFVLDAKPQKLLTGSTQHRLTHGLTLPHGFYVVLARVQVLLSNDWATTIVKDENRDPMPQDKLEMAASLRLLLGSIEDEAEVALNISYEDPLHQTTAKPSVGNMVSVSLELWGESSAEADVVSLWGSGDTAWIPSARIVAIQTDQINVWNARDEVVGRAELGG
jgi:hypothetical protein